MKKNIYQKCSRMTAVFLATAMLLTGCGGSGDTPSASEKAESTTRESTDTTKETDSADTKKDTEKQQDAEQKEVSGDTASYLTDASDAPEVAGLTCQGKLKLEYADCFDVYYYEDDYQLIDVHDSAQYLLVPEGAEAPEGLDDSIIVLQKPLDKIYLAASSTMALFRALDSMDNIKMSGIDASGWYIEEAKQAMEDGKIQFAASRIMRCW